MFEDYLRLDRLLALLVAAILLWLAGELEPVVDLFNRLGAREQLLIPGFAFILLYLAIQSSWNFFPVSGLAQRARLGRRLDLPIPRPEHGPICVRGLRGETVAFRSPSSQGHYLELSRHAGPHEHPGHLEQHEGLYGRLPTGNRLRNEVHGC